MERGSGILLHISSLASPFGIGTLGRAADQFAEFLSRAGVKYWQILPVSPTGFGDSPYQSFSAFAGNTLFIDIESLIADGLLLECEVQSLDFGDPGRVEYCAVRASRELLFRRAFSRMNSGLRRRVDEFSAQNSSWLDDYAMFMTIKSQQGNAPFSDWEDAFKYREPYALEFVRRELYEELEYHKLLQYLFFSQWKSFRATLGRLKIKLIGDMPIYVSQDCAEVWAHPQLFMLDSHLKPRLVAGVPPDYFSKTGQLWGNPLYDWDAAKSTGYAFWRARIAAASKLFDVLRIDHFRGFESFYAIKSDAPTAENGEWLKGPGMDLVSLFCAASPGLEIIAEDLGVVTDGLKELLRESGLPGMKVLEFAFDSDSSNEHLPHNYTKNCVCYSGTHDNNTLEGFLGAMGDRERNFAQRYFALNFDEGYSWGILRGGMASVANIFVAQLQDYLGVDARGRMNIPGTVGGNWMWRFKWDDITYSLAEKIRLFNSTYARL